MLSDSSKSAFNMVSEDPRKNIAKKYKKKTLNCPASLANLSDLSRDHRPDNPVYLVRPPSTNYPGKENNKQNSVFFEDHEY